MKIVYEVRLYDTPLLELILEEKKGKGLGLAAVTVCGGGSEAFTTLTCGCQVLVYCPDLRPHDTKAPCICW